MKKPKTTKALDAMTDLVLAYRPKPKSKPAKKRKRRAAKARKENEALAVEKGVMYIVPQLRLCSVVP